MALFSTLPTGTTIVATRDFGPVISGQPGIVVGRCRSPGLPWTPQPYVCTFLGDITVAMPRRCIMSHHHCYSLRMLADPFWFFHCGYATRKADPPRAEQPRSARWRDDVW